MSDSIVDLKRAYYATALGLTDEEAAAMSINDLEFLFFTSPPAAGGGATIDTTGNSSVLLLGRDSGAGAQQNANLLVLSPIVVPVDIAFTGIAVHVTTTAGGSTITPLICTLDNNVWTPVFVGSNLDSSTGGVKSQTGLSETLAAGYYWVGALANGGSPQCQGAAKPPSTPYVTPYKGSLTGTIDGPVMYASPVNLPVPATINVADNSNAVSAALLRLGGVTYP